MADDNDDDVEEEEERRLLVSNRQGGLLLLLLLLPTHKTLTNHKAIRSARWPHIPSPPPPPIPLYCTEILVLSSPPAAAYTLC